MTKGKFDESWLNRQTKTIQYLSLNTSIKFSDIWYSLEVYIIGTKVSDVESHMINLNYRKLGNIEIRQTRGIISLIASILACQE